MPIFLRASDIKRLFLPLAFGLLLAAAACRTKESGAVAGPDDVAVTYLSQNGDRLLALFHNRHHTVSLKPPSGPELTLPRAASGSGARFSQDDKTFWEHQGEAQFFIGNQLIFKGRAVSDL